MKRDQSIYLVVSLRVSGVSRGYLGRGQGVGAGSGDGIVS